MVQKTLVIGGLLGAIACGTSGAAGPMTPRLARAHDWAGRGQWISADLHVHTRYSDGAHSIPEVVAKARAHGCGAIAIADHADARGRGATPEYAADIQAARAANPETAILAGLEWNIPPWGGEEHGTVIVAPGPAESSTLSAFKRQFDDFQLDGRAKPTAAAALAWLEEAARTDPPPVVIYNHPSRPDAASIENIKDISGWRSVNDLVIGFEGAPGHQRYNPVGGYKYKEKPIDRWDPVVARPGDAWDTLLQGGMDVHGAIAGSDFHNASPNDLHDFWPCEFAETWLYVPERSPSGVLRALRAGTFFGAHGHIARAVELTVASEGLPRAALPGEAIVASPGTTLSVSLALDVPERDWEGRPNRVDSVDLIAIEPGNVSVRTHALTGTGRQTVTDTFTLGPAGLVVRARGRRAMPDGPALMFYTNAVRITAGPSR